MTATHDPFGSLGAPGGRRPDDTRPAPDPWETGERIFGIQWNTGEQRLLDAEWHAGQQAFGPAQQRAPRRHIGHPRPARAVPPPVYAPPPEPPRERRGRGWLAAVLIVVALLTVSGLQTWRLDRNNDRLAAVLATERDRTDRLAKQLAGVFDPEAISTTVLPSVFRVRAGEFTGTAFAVGDQASVHLLTNYHVVESVWSAGDRKVTLERG